MTRSLHLTARERSIVLAVRAMKPGEMATITAKPVEVAGPPRYTCLGDGLKPCYKAGHSFSERGMYGLGTTKGHSDLNPSHVIVAI